MIPPAVPQGASEADRMTPEEHAAFVAGLTPADLAGCSAEYLSVIALRLASDLAALRVRCDQQERSRRELFEALKDVLDSAERMRRGDNSLDPEEWHARRDFARHILSLVEAEGPNG